MGKMAQIKIPSPRHRAQTPISHCLLHKANPPFSLFFTSIAKNGRRGSSGRNVFAALSGSLFVPRL